MQQLLKEAFHSYQIYLQCSGVLDVHQAKLSLLLWPDIANTAIELLDKPDDTSLKAILLKDLEACMVKPIEAVYDATVLRIKEVVGKRPTPKIAKSDSLEYKKSLIRSINRMFVTLNTLTNVEYPALAVKEI